MKPLLLLILTGLSSVSPLHAGIGIGAKPPPGAEVLFDGSRGMLDGKWNSYDIVFRAARFKDGKLTEKPLVTLYFNGVKAHTNQPINQVWGGAKSGIDGGNDGGKGITDTPGGLKLQCEGHDVRYRNIWIKKLDLNTPDTDFEE